MSEAWLFQRTDQVKEMGEELAPWCVGWYEPDGRRKSKTCGLGPSGKKLADRLKNKLTAELMTGTYQQKTTVLWDDFVREYERRILDGLEPRTKAAALISLAHFKRLVKPARVFAIDAGHVDDFTAKRRKERGRKKDDTVSPATVNKDLRHVRAALSVAVEWGYLARKPRVRMERQPKRLPRFVSPEHFAAIYAAAETARKPAGLPFPPADWWRGLFVLAYMTGWRIGDMLALQREDLDLAGAYAVTRCDDNKGDRDDKVKLHPVAVDHLAKLACFEPVVFPWPHDRRTLDVELDRLQAVAGVHLQCPRRHTHTPACHVYSWHDFRRAFATMNAARLTPDALQALMRHKTYTTTQVYINLASQIDDAVKVLHVPDVLRRAGR
jgi:integrase